MSTNAEFCLKHGAELPYDASDKWWASDGMPAPKADDWAHAAARGVLADLEDRRGIKWELEKVDEETRVEIIQSIAAIIRLASKEQS